MKKIKLRFWAVFTVAVLLIAATLPVSANIYDESYYMYFDTIPNGWLTERVDGVDYAYKVADGEAVLLDIKLNHYEPENMVLTLPTTLGGYPVTTIGEEDAHEVMLYRSYTGSLQPEGFDAENFGGAEYDPGCLYLSKLIIPEGYEYIHNQAFYGACWTEFVFPQSLKKIYGSPFESSYVYKNKLFHMPECEYDNIYSFCSVLNSVGDYVMVVTPSRFPGLAKDVVAQTDYTFYFRGTDVYFPANLSAKDFIEMFFYDAWSDSKNCSVIIPLPPEFKIHCAPDCDWLALLDNLDYETCFYDGNFNLRENFSFWDCVTTDVVPATSIAFDSATVYIAKGDYKDIEAKTYPAEALWTACDYVSSNPDVVKVDEYSGRITALKEGTATITATHCERGFTDSYNVVVLADGVELPPDEPKPEEPTTEEPTTEEPTTEEPTTEEPTTEEPTTEEPTTEEPTTEEPTTEEPTTEEPTTEEPTTEEPTTEEPTTEEPTTEEPTTEEPTTEEPPADDGGESFFARLWNFILKIVQFIVNTFKSIFGIK